MCDEALTQLCCPLCSGPLHRVPGGLACPAGHAFDLARQGYVNLAGSAARPAGDTVAMVAARDEFLARGHFAFIADALAGEAARIVTGTPVPAEAATDRASGSGPRRPALVVDAGAGTGYHLARVLDAVPGALGLALDASKPAVRRAARAHPRAAAAVADTWGRLPLADGSVTVLLNVFAPRNGAEFGRVLRPDGALLVVTPGAGHLRELVDALDLLRVDPTKQERLEAGLRPRLRPERVRPLEATLRLNAADVRALVAMGPSSWHVDPEHLDRRVAALPEPVPVTASVRLSVWRPS